MTHHVGAGEGEGNEEEKRKESNEADMELFKSHRRTQKRSIRLSTNCGNGDG